MVANKLNKYCSGSALLGVLFLLAAAIVGVTLVTNKNITLNPGKKAEVYGCYCPSSACFGGCWWGSGGPYKCSDSKCSTPAPVPTKTPTPKPATPTPTPTGICNRNGYDFLCSAGDYSEKECMDTAVRHYTISKGVIVIPNCCYTLIVTGSKCHMCYVLPTSSTPTPTPKPATPTPTPKPSVQVVKITSGTCTQKCISIKGSCLSVGTNSTGDNKLIMSWHNYRLCETRTGVCNSNIAKLSSGGTTCSGTLPEWTNCRCKINLYVN